MLNSINHLRGLLLIALLCFISACGSDGGDSHYVTEVQLTAEKTSFPAGVSQTVEGQAIYSDGEISDASSGNSLWTSDDETIAVVDNKGLVTGVSAGTVLINANYLGGDGTASGSISITITEAVLVEIEIIPSDKSVPLGLHMKYQAIGTYSDKTEHLLDNNSDIRWSSSEPIVATIDSTTAIADTLKVGETTITIDFQGIQSNSTLLVTNESLVRLMVSPVEEGNTSSPAGYTLNFVAEALYTDDSIHDVTNLASWDSSSSAVLRLMNTNGQFEAVTPGDANVSATLELKTSNDVAVTVTHGLLESVEIISMKTSFPIGTSEPLTARGYFSGETNEDITDEDNVTWKSASPEIASVNLAGKFTAIAVGEVDITLNVTNLNDEIFSDTQKFTVTAAELVNSSVKISPRDLFLAPGESRKYIATGEYTDGTTHILTSSQGLSWYLSDDNDANYTDGVSINSHGVITTGYESTRDVTKKLSVDVHVDGFDNVVKTYTYLSAVKILNVNDISFVSPFTIEELTLLDNTPSQYQSLVEDGTTGPVDTAFAKLTHTAANDMCENLIYNKHDDYRLPNFQELTTLWIEYDGVDDENSTLYTEEKWSVGEYFWTSDSANDASGAFKIVDLSKGTAQEASIDTIERYVSCVRSSNLP